MGNAVSGPAVRVQAGALDGYVSELGPDIVYGQRYDERFYSCYFRNFHSKNMANDVQPILVLDNRAFSRLWKRYIIMGRY